MKTNMKTTRVIMAICAATLVTGVYAKGGVAPAPGLFTVSTLATPAFTATQAAALHGFDITGFLQNATVSSSNAACPTVTDPTRWGGTANVNGINITIPCNMIIQMPANTFKWADMVHGGSDMTLIGGSPLPFELNVVGNSVGGQNIAGLMYISQESLNGTTGVIQAIDYTTGNLKVNTGDPAHPVIVQINDPNGRFGRPQSPDPRLSVDDENPTIHAGTGYPMCIPRTLTDPNTTSVDDPLCPKKNRPKATSGSPCRLFGQTGITLPTSGELTVTPAGNFCTQFVMKAPLGTIPTTLVPATYIATSVNEPDARQQAPMEVGDTIAFSGTLMHDTAGNYYISAHTIEVNVGIYTQPKSQPSYLAIGEFGIGTADPTLLAANGAAQETQDRIFLETETTDVYTPVDIYMVDVDPVTGVEYNRWVSMNSMTTECSSTALTAQCMGLEGGVTTQYTQAQPQRARVRLAKATPGILSAPSRTMRVMARTLCKPSISDLSTTTGHSASLDTCFANTQDSTKPSFNVVANGLLAGQYSAPVFEYIFPENTKQGDPIVPNDLWHLPFLVNGEGSSTADGVGPLTPKPW
jgi:hypothetical protein